MSVLSILIPSVLALAAFCHILFVKKFSWKAALPFALAVFLMTQFITGRKWTLHWTVSRRPPVFLLADGSLSMKGYFDGPIPGGRSYAVRYFASRLFRDSTRKAGDAQSTSLYDSVRLLKNEGGPRARVILLSDLRDNASAEPLEQTEGVLPLVFTNAPAAPGPFLTRTDIPDYFETGGPVPLRLEVRSPRAGDFIGVSIREGDRTLLDRNYPLARGSNSITAEFYPRFEGAGVVTVRIRSGESSVSFQRALFGMPARSRILLLCGRPSAEFAFLRRFLERLSWIRTDSRVLVRPGEKFPPPDTGRYHGVIVMDASPEQFANMTSFFSQAASSRVPVLIQTGLRPLRDISALASVFPDVPDDHFRALRDPAAVSMKVGQEELPVLVSVSSPSVLFDAGQRARIFTGWDTWKWDFEELARGLSLNRFERFWQNQIQYLLKDTAPGHPFRTLNFLPGAPDPARYPTNGIYSVVSNGTRYLLSVQDNPAETFGGPGMDPAALDGFGDRLVFKGWQDLNDQAERLTAKEKVRVRKSLTIDPAQDPAVWILVFLCLALFWAVKDRELSSR